MLTIELHNSGFNPPLIDLRPPSRESNYPYTAFWKYLMYVSDKEAGMDLRALKVQCHPHKAWWLAHMMNVDLRQIDLDGVSTIAGNDRLWTGVNLSYTNLSGRGMNYLTMKDVDFTGARMDGAWLYQCGLTNVCFKGADMRGATVAFTKEDKKGRPLDFRGVDLTGADLSYSNLTRANFDGANLQDADLTGADIRNASIEGVNFDGALIQGAHLPRSITVRQLEHTTGRLDMTYDEEIG